jgi:hypothetical protein
MRPWRPCRPLPTLLHRRRGAWLQTWWRVLGKRPTISDQFLRRSGTQRATSASGRPTPTMTRGSGRRTSMSSRLLRSRRPFPHRLRWKRHNGHWTCLPLPRLKQTRRAMAGRVRRRSQCQHRRMAGESGRPFPPCRSPPRRRRVLRLCQALSTTAAALPRGRLPSPTRSSQLTHPQMLCHPLPRRSCRTSSLGSLPPHQWSPLRTHGRSLRQLRRPNCRRRRHRRPRRVRLTWAPIPGRSRLRPLQSARQRQTRPSRSHLRPRPPRRWWTGGMDSSPRRRPPVRSRIRPPRRKRLCTCSVPHSRHRRCRPPLRDR